MKPEHRFKRGDNRYRNRTVVEHNESDKLKGYEELLMDVGFKTIGVGLLITIGTVFELAIKSIFNKK